MSNPSGLCLCGCGQATKLRPVTWKKKGWVKGQPKEFMKGHNARLPEAKNRASKILKSVRPIRHARIKAKHKLGPWKAGQTNRVKLLVKQLAAASR